MEQIENADYRKSIGGWSVDVKTNGNWSFYQKFRCKKDAITCIEQLTNKKK